MGPTALATLALIKSTGKPDDPEIANLITFVRGSVNTAGYRPQIANGDIYEAAVVLMALATANADVHSAEIEAIARFLVERQSDNGSWDYSKGGSGDTSQSQYAILALWEAAATGFEVPVQVWDRALNWFITRQDVSGGFTYHPRDPGGESRVPQGEVTHSMSVAGAGSIIICRSQLPFKQTPQSLKDRELLIPVEEEGKKDDYKPIVTRERADQALTLANRWMAANLTIDKSSGPRLYFLYGLERYAALANLKTVGTTDWYAAGADYLVKNQRPDGSWTATYEANVDTAFAILFLGRSTQKTITRIQINRLGRGTMVGGRGIPDPNVGAASGLLARRNARYARALQAPVSDLLALLDDPADDEDLEGAAVALETVDSAELIRAIGGDKPKLRHLAKDPRPEVRRAALWSLARTRDLRVAPVLIDRLADDDPEVYRAARDSLRYLSRRMDGFGLPADPPAQSDRAAGIGKWKEWFDSLLIQVEPVQEFDE